MKARKLIFFILLILLASLSLNIYLYTLTRNYYLQLNGLRLDPLGLTYSRNTPPAETDRPLAVFFGDSRAFQWPAPSTESFTFYNLGLGSQTSEQVASRYDLQIPPLEPDILILQVGINDLKTIPLFPELKERLIQQCKDNITEIVGKATSDETTVVLTTIIPPGEIPLERRFVWSDEVAIAIEEVNQFIYSLESSDVLIFDSAQTLVGENGIVRKEYCLDFLHINAIGYEALNRALIPVLENLHPSSP